MSSPRLKDSEMVQLEELSNSFSIGFIFRALTKKLNPEMPVRHYPCLPPPHCPKLRTYPSWPKPISLLVSAYGGKLLGPNGYTKIAFFVFLFSNLVATDSGLIDVALIQFILLLLRSFFFFESWTNLKRGGGGAGSVRGSNGPGRWVIESKEKSKKPLKG